MSHTIFTNIYRELVTFARNITLNGLIIREEKLSDDYSGCNECAREECIPKCIPSNTSRSTDRSQLVSAPHLHAFKAFPHPDSVLPATPPLPVRRNRCLNKIALDSNRSRNGLLSDLFIYGL